MGGVPRVMRLARLRWATWRTGILDNVRVVLRPPPAFMLLGFGCLAIVASGDLPNHFALPRGTDPFVASLVFAALLAAFLLCSLALWPLESMSVWPHWLFGGQSPSIPLRRALARGARLLWYPLLLWMVLASAQSLLSLARTVPPSFTARPPRYTSDDLYDNQYNALLVLDGTNPYVGDHLAASLAYFHTDGYTPLQRGEFISPYSHPTVAQVRAILAAYRAHPQSPLPEVSPLITHSYPAGSFLVDIPFVWAGLPSITPAQALLLLLLCLGLVGLAPPSWRLVLGLLLLCDTVAMTRVLDGDFDIWWIVPLVGAWWCAPSRVRSAVLVGVACAIKQLAWFLAPFYLVFVWRRYGWREALTRTAIASLTFLGINLPWIVMSPGAWLSSLFLPMSLPLLPEGTGLTGLAFAHVLPLFPKLVYTLLEAAVALAALGAYWRFSRRAPMLGLVLGFLPLVVAWRGDERYFLTLSLVAGAAVVLAARDGVRGEADAAVAVAAEPPAEVSLPLAVRAHGMD